MPVLRQYLDFQRHISLSCLYCMISCESWLLFSKPGKGEVMYMHVSRILFASVSTVRRLDFRIVPLVCMGGLMSYLRYLYLFPYSCVQLCSSLSCIHCVSLDCSYLDCPSVFSFISESMPFLLLFLPFSYSISLIC